MPDKERRKNKITGLFSLCMIRDLFFPKYSESLHSIDKEYNSANYDLLDDFISLIK